MDGRPLRATTRVALTIAVVYGVVAAGHWIGLWGTDWSQVSEFEHAALSAEHPLGTNAIGQDVLARTLASSATAFETGLSVALATALLGMALGAVAGYWQGGWIDRLVQWLAGVLDAIPFLLFVAAVVWATQRHPLAMHLAMMACFWTTTARLVRAEVLRLKPLPFVEAAQVLGLTDLRILRRHILPNTTHVVLVQATLVFVAAIKTEVILSFLGLGLRDGVSWGVMIAESSQDILAGHFNSFLAGSVALFAMVMAFNHLADATQDALDPRMDGP